MKFKLPKNKFNKRCAKSVVSVFFNSLQGDIKEDLSKCRNIPSYHVLPSFPQIAL